jgi:hypothetical protein
MQPQNEAGTSAEKLPGKREKPQQISGIFRDFETVGIAIRRNTKTEGGQIPCWKRSSEKMNTWISARIAAACFRKMPGVAERSSARTNVARHGIIGIPT